MNQFRKRNSSKVKIDLALLTTTVCSVVLSTLSIRQFHKTGSVLDWVQTNRATISIFVYFISGILGGLQLYVVTVLINWRSNLHLLSYPTPLDTLKTRSALANGRLDFDLPWKALVLVIIFFLGSQAPAALWTGAVTPVLTTADAEASLKIAKYTLNDTLWQTNCQPNSYCSHNLIGNSSTLGVFSYVGWRSKFVPGSNLESTTHHLIFKLDQPFLRTLFLKHQVEKR